jgi:hypothetical protein
VRFPIINLVGFILLSFLLSGCAITPSYTVRVENQSTVAVMARLERRATINDVVEMDSAKVAADSSATLGPANARVLERVYIVIGDSDDLRTLPKSIKLSRGEWVVTVSAGSMTSWGSYEITVNRD